MPEQEHEVPMRFLKIDLNNLRVRFYDPIYFHRIHLARRVLLQVPSKRGRNERGLE